MEILERRPIHAGRLERWLGAEKIAKLQQDMDGWYGPPINIRDVPGSVYVTADGDFVGEFHRGGFASAFDQLSEHFKRIKRGLIGPDQVAGGMDPAFGVGFASISDALLRASSGDGQILGGGGISKAGSVGVVGVSNSLWRAGTYPVAGAAGSAAPGGRAPTKDTAGALLFNNPASGTLHLVGADMNSAALNHTLLLYDRIFDVAKTMNSAATEAVTGVPTRYQSVVPTNPDWIGGNFLFVEVGGVALPATSHNWTVCTYKDETDATSTLPSIVGTASAGVNRFDMPVGRWYAPLEGSDCGIKALTQMQCSAAVATGLINFVIGHPLGFMSFGPAWLFIPFDWLTAKQQAPRIFNDACLSLIEPTKTATSANTYSGCIYATRAAP